MSSEDFILPRFAVGTGAISGFPEDTTLPTDLEAQVALVKDALEQFKNRGMRPWIDTALHYGAGNALIAIGEALGNNPASITLSIKTGRILEKRPEHITPDGPFRGEGPYLRRFDYSREGTLGAVEQSFEFLNRNRIKLGWKTVKLEDLNTVVYVHDPESGVHGENTERVIRQVKEEALPALAELKKEGKIKAIGVGTNEIACACALVAHPDLDIVMVAGRLTLLAHHAFGAPQEVLYDTEGLPELLQEVRKHGKQVVSAAPGSSGILYGGTWYNYKPASQEVLEFRDRMAEACQKHGVSLSAAALQFPARAGARAVVPGPASLEQLRKSFDNFIYPIPDALWETMEAQGLIDNTIRQHDGIRKKLAS